MTPDIPENQEAQGGEAPSASSATQAADEAASLQQRVQYLEQITASMAAELAYMRQSEPRLFRTSAQPALQPIPVNSSVPVVVAGEAPFAAPPVSVPLQSSPAHARTESLESQFGSRVLSKVAVVLLLFGAAWFLKWAFENRWIGPTGRVIAGLAAGVSIVLWSERFRRQRFAAFSYALKAVGSGVLYLSLWAAFQLYHLVPSTVALIAMIAVTAWNAFMAWSQDAELLAGYALLGAYLTPALLTTGGDHEVFLFNYLLVIAAAVLALLRGKPWTRLLLGALPATGVYYIAWYAMHFEPQKAGLTLAYALLLWAVFAAVPLVAQNEGVIASVLTPISTAAFGALTVYSVLVDSGRRPEEPWWAVGFAAVYLLLARLRLRSLVSAIHLSLGVVFLTIAIPLKATGHGITAGWLAEAVALLWVVTLPTVEARARTALRWLAYGSLALGVGGALLGPTILDHAGQPFANRNFATSLGAIAALAAAIFFERRSRSAAVAENGVAGEAAPGSASRAASALLAIHLVLLVAMYREIMAYAYKDMAVGAWHIASERAGFIYSAWMMLQGAASLALGFWRREPLSRWIGLVLLAATVLKALLYDMRNLGTGYRVVSFLGLGVVLMAVSFAYQRDWLGLREAIAEEPRGEVAP